MHASDPTLFRHLLAFPYAENGEEQTKEKDLTKLPHIITICNYLCHPNHDKPDVRSLFTLIRIHFAEAHQNDELRDNIITLLSTLALIHQDALTILLKSRTLIPSIVVYLSNICTPIWEDEDTVLTRPGHASRYAPPSLPHRSPTNGCSAPVLQARRTHRARHRAAVPHDLHPEPAVRPAPEAAPPGAPAPHGRRAHVHRHHGPLRLRGPARVARRGRLRQARPGDGCVLPRVHVLGGG